MPQAEAQPKSKPVIVTAIAGELWQGDSQLQVGDEVVFDSELKAKKGYAVVRVDAVGLVRISKSTRIHFAKRHRLRLFFGKLWAKVSKLGSGGFEVETDNAVAGVRGTEFVVERTKRKTRVAVVEGRVALRGAGAKSKEVLIAAGQQSDVGKSGAPRAAHPFKVAEDKKILESLSESPLTAPPVRVDREKMDKHEKRGEEQLKDLKQESDKERDDLQKQEDETRERFQDKKKLEENLDKDMGNKGSLRDGKSMKPKSLRPSKKKDSEIDEMLK